jgi:hypothetical protein
VKTDADGDCRAIDSTFAGSASVIYILPIFFYEVPLGSGS